MDHDEITKTLLSKLVDVADEVDIADFIEAGVIELLSQAWQEYVGVNPGSGYSYLTDQDYRVARDVAYQLINKLKESND